MYGVMNGVEMLFFSHGSSQARRVAILVNRQFFCNFVTQKCDNQGRLLEIQMEVEGAKISIINVYAPNKDSPEYMKELESFCMNSAEKRIVCGDFNLAMNVSLDKSQN